MSILNDSLSSGRMGNACNTCNSPFLKKRKFWVALEVYEGTLSVFIVGGVNFSRLQESGMSYSPHRTMWKAVGKNQGEIPGSVLKTIFDFFFSLKKLISPPLPPPLHNLEDLGVIWFDSSLVVHLPENQDFVPNRSVNQMLENQGHFFLSIKGSWLMLWQIQIWDFKIFCNTSRIYLLLLSEFPMVPNCSLSVLRNWSSSGSLSLSMFLHHTVGAICSHRLRCVNYPNPLLWVLTSLIYISSFIP